MKSEKLSDSGDSHCIRYIKGITSFITSLKNWNQILVLLITGCILLTSHISYGQVVSEGAAVKANFGIDADLYANRQQVGNMIAPNVDDWFFSSTWPGTGEGVIDQTNAASLKSSIQGNNNYSFVKRMSKPRNTIVNGITWIDAVYVRDNNSIGGNKDATVFTGTKDKNGDNPSSWNLGSGGTPPKNDIIDAFGHMRMDSDGVWGIGALTKISEDGTSHADFEFFSGQLTLNGGGTLTGIGPDAGHTAWKFNADGSIISAGDLIVIINFTNGGTVPNFSVRVWISETDRINFNARPNRTFDLTGEFNSGLNAAGFGYAEITGKNGAVDPSVWAIVNVGTSTIGAPWGTLVGSQASYAENIIALQYMEFAINLTKLGLEGFGGVGCNKVLGSLMVKTRSSAEFTAELKDFVGPFLFGFELITDLNLTPTHATCNGGTGSISTEIVGAPLNDFQIQLDSGAWVNVTSSPYVFNNVSAGSHTVSVRRISDNTCMATKSTNINEPDALGLVLTPTHATCFGGAKSISAAVTGTPLSDLEIRLDDGTWAAVTASPVVFNGVASGAHTVALRRISDNSCVTSQQTTVNEPDALGLVLTPTHATCFGGAKSISAAVTGTPLSDLEIRLDDGTWAAVTASPVVFNGVASGAHTVALRRISDNSCMTSQQTTVNEPDALGLVLTPTHATCFGGAKSISAAVTGTPLSDLEIRLDDGTWTAVTASPVVFNGVASGAHTVALRRISDNSCMTSQQTTVNEPDALGLVLTPTHATCFGGAKSISAAVTGTPLSDLEIRLDDGTWAAVTASPVVFNGVASGAHTVALRRISDNSCMTSQQTTVNEPDALGLVLTPTHATCFGGAKSISAAVTGTPLSDLEIRLDDGTWTAVTASPVVFNGVASGAHTVALRRISDNSCMTSQQTTVNEPDALGLVLTPTHATCFGGAKSISAAVTGTPLSDLEIRLDDGTWTAVTASPVVFNGVASGAHTVALRRISDNSCMTSQQTTVNEPDALGLVLTPTHATCFGGAKSISAAVTGTPLSDLEIRLDDGTWAAVTASPVVFNGVASGAHTVALRRISDNSCMTSQQTTVNEPDALGLVLTPTHATCFGGAKSISAAVTGTPLSDLEIRLDDGTWTAVTASPVVFNGVASGAHTVALRRISDNSCMTSQQTTVNEPDALGLVLTPTHATCFGGAKSISAAVTGTPLSDLEIRLDDGTWTAVTASPVVFNGVASGAHTVALRRISDNSCMTSQQTTVNEPDALGLVLTPTHATCFGGAKSISAAVTGTPLSDLEIRLDDGTWTAVTASPVVFNGVASGAHTVALRRISDNSCMTSQQTTVNEPDALDLVLSPGDKTCIGQTDGSISAAVTGTPLSDLEIRLDDGTWAAVTASPVMFTGLAGGIHTITVRRISDYTCLIAKETTVIEEPCDNLICTYTQGFYGNAGGIACTEEGSFTSLQLIQRSLDNMDGVIDNIGSMYIGLAGNSFTVSYTNANNLIGLLPGGGDISVLMADYNYMNVPLNKQNRIKNGLLAQTIVLGLNLNMHTDASNSVGNFVLEGGKYLVTVKRAASSTCEDPLMADCAIELNAMKSWMIPANVVDALPAPKDVWALYKLASDALGGAVLPVGVSLNDIHMTVDRINNAFDNCRYFLRWSDVNEVCPIPIIEPVISSEPSIETRVAEVNTVGFEVYPVPFENEITIKYKFDYNSFVRIEMYDSSGNVILSKVDNDGYLNKEIQLYLNMNIGKEQMYIVRLTTDRESVVKKIISTK